MTAVITTLMLLTGLVTPVAAAVPAAAPTGVVADLSGTTKIEVTWTVVPPGSDGGEVISGYEVSLDSGGTWTFVAGIDAAAYTSPDLEPAEYVAQVRAVNVDGEGPPANANSVTVPAPPATAPTAAPTGVTLAALGTNRLTVAWAAVAPASNGGQDITGYEYSLNNGVSWDSAGGPSATSFNTPVQTPGPYRARVRAVNGIGEGPQSDPQSNLITIAAANTAPGAPTAVTAARVGPTSNVTVGWTAPNNTGGVPITRYDVRRDTGAWVSAGLVNPFTLPGLADGQPHTYQVRAVNSVGPSAPSAASATVTIPAPLVAPSNVNAVVNAANTEVTVTWDAPTGDVAEYVVSLSPENADEETVGAADRTVTFSGLPAGGYTVSVKARNADGTSPAGTDIFDIVVAPGAPRNVKTTNEADVRKATVTWDAPANNGNGTISGYKITMGGQTQSVAATARQVSFTNLPVGKLTAVVVAVNAQGDSAPGSSPEFRSERPVHPFETEPAFVNQVYSDLFSAGPTAAEIANVTASLTADGSNGPTIINNLMRSARFENRRQVSRLYFAYFLRVPDEAGQTYWGSKMDSGELDLQGVSDLFALSPEFQNTYGGLDEQEFLVVVYNNVLGRVADVGGFNYWLAERQKGLSRGGVMTWFTEGEEYKSLSLPAIDTSLAHIMLLDRAPSGAEYALWVNRITKEPNTTLETLVALIYDSDEYAARVTP